MSKTQNYQVLGMTCEHCAGRRDCRNWIWSPVSP